jgi:hypothetical protein
MRFFILSAILIGTMLNVKPAFNRPAVFCPKSMLLDIRNLSRLWRDSVRVVKTLHQQASLQGRVLHRRLGSDAVG